MSKNIKNFSIIKQKSSRDDLKMRICMLVIGLFLALAIILPLYTMFSKSLSLMTFLAFGASESGSLYRKGLAVCCKSMFGMAKIYICLCLASKSVKMARRTNEV